MGDYLRPFSTLNSHICSCIEMSAEPRAPGTRISLPGTLNRLPSFTVFRASPVRSTFYTSSQLSRCVVGLSGTSTWASCFCSTMKDNYDRFMGAKSRKRFFERHAKSWTAVSPHIRQCLTKAYDDIPDSMLNRGPPDRALGAPLSGTRREVEPVFPGDLVRLIDALDRIRTAEAHGTGTLRKWSLAMQPLHESKDFSLIHHWNIANSFMHHVRRALLDLTQ